MKNSTNGARIAVRSARIDGVKMHYLTAGQGEPVILLHGYTQTSRMWRPVTPALTDRFTVIAPDLPGIGDSGIPKDGLDMTSAALRVRALAKTLGAGRARVGRPRHRTHGGLRVRGPLSGDSPEATAFAKTGEPSYAGITDETYVGTARREPGAINLEGHWQSSRQCAGPPSSAQPSLRFNVFCDCSLFLRAFARNSRPLALPLIEPAISVWPWPCSADVREDATERPNRSTRPGSMRLMYRIHRSGEPGARVFALSGVLDGELATRLQELLGAEADGPFVLDLKDVTLVDRDAVLFLSRTEAAGTAIVNCPEYVRRWITAEENQ